jgi:hypothetical protein
MRKILMNASVIVLAVVLTIVGASHTLLHKVFSRADLAVWFPVCVITNTYGDGLFLLLAVLQFPALGLLFILLSRKYSAVYSFLLVVAVYVLAVVVAVSAL